MDKALTYFVILGRVYSPRPIGAVVGDFLDKPVAMVGLALSRYTASAALFIFLEDLMPMAEQKNIDIGITSNAELNLLISEGDLTCIVKNLVDNAIRYTPVGGRVDLSVASTNAGITLLIEDSGAGIPEEERKRVFDPFYRVLGNDEIGSGLGLSIVQAIVMRVGATVDFDFTNQQFKSGLKVTVTFPMQ